MAETFLGYEQYYKYEAYKHA